MKLVRFENTAGNIQIGEPIDDSHARLIEGDLFEDFAVTEALGEIRHLLPPVDPVDIIAIGLNYRRHAEETGMGLPDAPVVFSKLTSAVIPTRDPIILPTDAPDEVDYEAELALVIGKTARRVSEHEALDYVLGYTAANDVSARDCQRHRDRQWTRAKSFDTFCPLGPALLIDKEIDPNNLSIRTTLNGQVMQDSNTSDAIFSVKALIAYLSAHFTLRPGTVILTGTPEGVGMGHTPPVFLKDGDTVTVAIEGIGELTNPVRAEDTRM